MTAGKRLIASRMERLQPGMRKAMFSASAEYGPIAAEIRRRTSDGDGTPYALEVGCPPRSHRVGRFTQDRGLVYDGIRAAYGAMLTGRRQRPRPCPPATHRSCPTADLLRESRLTLDVEARAALVRQSVRRTLPRPTRVAAHPGSTGHRRRPTDV